LIDEDILGTNSHCSKCGDVCPPGKSFTSVYDWGCSNKQCKTWKCKYPYFDVNNDPADGCEITDTSWNNYTKAAAKYIGEMDENGKYEMHLCNGRLPRDSRANIYNSSDMSADEGVDYFYFKYIGKFWGIKQATLKVVANPVGANNYTGTNVTSPSGTIQVCVSGNYSSTTSSPTIANCQNINLSGSSAGQVVFGSDYFKHDGDNYYYIMVKAVGSYKFSGKFHIQVIEESASNDITGSNSACN
jgi:hypothetical protein